METKDRNSSAMRRCTGETRSTPPLRAKAKARREENAALQAENARLREENAILLARLQQRNPTLAAEQAAHDETFKEKQSLQRFRVIATSLIDALLAGRAARPEFAELLNLTKAAADAIERGDRHGFSRRAGKVQSLRPR